MKVFYGAAYAAAGHHFATTRKARWVADDLYARPLPAVELTAPEASTAAELTRMHAAAYVEAVERGAPRALAESQGFAWSPSLWEAVTASNGGALAAARAALKDGVAGSLSSGMHHARRASGAGYCTFNGLALAADAVLREGLARRVLIVDLDAHGGGGTHELLADEPRVVHVDVSVDDYDGHPAAGEGSYDRVIEVVDYLPTVHRRLAALRGSFDLCVYNAGMDPHEGDPVGGLAGVTLEILAERERRVFSWARRAGVPVAFVLAGGYLAGPESDASVAEVVSRHRLTLDAALARS